jgi:hypothetical protein
MSRKIRRVPVPRSVEHALDGALDKALSVQRPVVVAYLTRVRRRNPTAAPGEIVRQLERRYLAAVIGTGAASGGAAALPGVGTSASVATGAAEIAAFISTTAMYVLALAEVYDVPVEDPQVRRALVLTVLLGEVGEAALAGGELETKHWARVLGRTSSKDTAKALNSRLAHLLVTRFGVRQGALVAGRALPFGIGAGVGAAGNAALGRSVVRTARRAFGPPPARFRHRVVDADPTPGGGPAGPARRRLVRRGD